MERLGRKLLVRAVLDLLRGRAGTRELRPLELALGMVLGIEGCVALSDIYALKAGRRAPAARD